MTIYTMWADRIIAGTHTFKQVPKAFKDHVRQILESQRYVIRRDGTVCKKFKMGGKA